MSTPYVELTGTVRPDGTLLLDGPVALAPGRVTVVVKPVSPSPLPELPRDDPFWQRMQAIWDRQNAHGHQPRSAEEADAALRELRDEWEERQQQIERLQEEGHAARHAKAEGGS